MATSSHETLPFSDDFTVLPVQSLEVVILDGAQAGTRAQADEEGLSIGSAEGNDLVLEDETVSRYHVELTRRPEGILIADTGSTNGVFIGTMRVERAVVQPRTELRIGRTTVRIDDGSRINVELNPNNELGSLKGHTPMMRRLFAQVRKAAQSDVPVLLIGESGTGKELFARAVHDLGQRASGPFVIVDCASLTPTLVASELFGHEKGSFTGADRQHVGAFEQAHGGTVFLDEIGELPEELQPKLLGVLERRRFRRLGGKSEIDVDVRVITATNRALKAEVNEGRFRLDLYYRIAVVRLAVPALRDRPEDIPILAAHFLAQMGETSDIGELFEPAQMAALSRHHWPGNVRELRNFVEAAVAMGEAPELDQGLSLGDTASGSAIPIGALLNLPYKDARATLLEQFEASYLPHIVEKAGGNVSQAARDSGMDRSHLWDLLRRHSIR